jgi:integrase/recombinase XerD
MHPEDFLSLDEWHELLKAVQSTREAALLWLLGGAGLRVSEVASLKVEHLDGQGWYLHVVDGKGWKAAHIHPAKACPRGSTRALKRPG